MARKVFTLLACGALVRVISPRIVAFLQAYVDAGRIEYHARCYRTGDLQDSLLAFAAINDAETEKLVIAEARERHVWINVASNPGACTFQVPAKVCRGDLLITVATGGASPALSAQIRCELEKQFGVAYEPFVELLKRVRQQIVTDGRPTSEHRHVFQKMLQSDLLQLVERQDLEALSLFLVRYMPAEVVAHEVLAGLFSRECE